MTKPRNFPELFEAFGNKGLSEVLEIPRSHVLQMINRGVIPPAVRRPDYQRNYYGRLVKAAPRFKVQGLTCERLLSWYAADDLKQAA